MLLAQASYHPRVKEIQFHHPFLAKPCAWSVRSFRQGSPLRFDERINRGLDGADGQAPSPAMKGFAFHARLPAAPLESRTQTSKQGVFPYANHRTYTAV